MLVVLYTFAEEREWQWTEERNKAWNSLVLPWTSTILRTMPISLENNSLKVIKHCRPTISLVVVVVLLWHRLYQPLLEAYWQYREGNSLSLNKRKINNQVDASNFKPSYYFSQFHSNINNKKNPTWGAFPQKEPIVATKH